MRGGFPADGDDIFFFNDALLPPERRVWVLPQIVLDLVLRIKKHQKRGGSILLVHWIASACYGATGETLAVWLQMHMLGMQIPHARV
jgi:hypothetical protein